MKFDTLPDRSFSDVFLEQLLKKCRIEECFREEVHSRLERTAKEWHIRRSALDHGMKPRDLEKTLRGLAREAHALKKRLKDLPDAVWSNLVEINELVSSEQYETRIENTGFRLPDYSHTGEPAITVLTSGPDGPFQTIETETLLSALHQLSEMASIAFKMNPPASLSDQKREPLDRWMLDMRNLWHGVLSRDFTRDQTAEGAPISGAAIFCVKVYAVLDKETKSSTVLLSMKDRIKEDNDLLKEHPDWMKNWKQRKKLTQ